MTEVTTITLKSPITFQADKFDGGGEKTISSVDVPQRIKAKHLRAMDAQKGEVGKALALIQAVTGLPQAAVDELDSDDVESISEALGGPLSERPGIGQTSSD
jgi:hypothetical protein